MHTVYRLLLAIAALAAAPAAANTLPRVVPDTYFIELDKNAVRL